VQYLEKVEWGLPAKDFVQGNTGRPRMSASSADPALSARRQVRFRQDSPWNANRVAGERLTWRGRNFIEAFVEVNDCNLVQATMLDLPAAQCRVATESWQAAEPGVEHYNLVCRASAGSTMGVGDDTVVLQAGDLWRVDSKYLPAIVRGGSEGGANLVLALARRDTRPLAMAADKFCLHGANNSGAAA
jgi:hypothetical protein